MPTEESPASLRAGAGWVSHRNLGAERAGFHGVKPLPPSRRPVYLSKRTGSAKGLQIVSSIPNDLRKIFVELEGHKMHTHSGNTLKIKFGSNE